MAVTGISLWQFFNSICMICGNAVLTSVILWTKKLRCRHELLLIAGLSVADLIYGCGYFVAALQTFSQHFAGVAADMMTPWQCYLQLKNTFFIVGSQTAALMQVMLSMDRLMAVRWFRAYLGFDTRYAMRILFCVYGYVLCSLVGIGFVSYNFTNHTDYSVQFCFSSSVATKGFKHYQPTVQMTCGVLSCLIYVATVTFYRSHIAQVAKDIGVSELLLERQKRITKLVGIATLGTFLTYVIPHGTILFLNSQEWPAEKIRTSMKLTSYAIGNYNSILNIFIFGIFHPDIRNALRNLFCGYHGEVAPLSHTHSHTHSHNPHSHSHSHLHPDHHPDNHHHPPHPEHHGPPTSVQVQPKEAL